MTSSTYLLFVIVAFGDLFSRYISTEKLWIILCFVLSFFAFILRIPYCISPLSTTFKIGSLFSYSLLFSSSCLIVLAFLYIFDDQRIMHTADYQFLPEDVKFQFRLYCFSCFSNNLLAAIFCGLTGIYSQLAYSLRNRVRTFWTILVSFVTGAVLLLNFAGVRYTSNLSSALCTFVRESGFDASSNLCPQRDLQILDIVLLLLSFAALLGIFVLSILMNLVTRLVPPEWLPLANVGTSFVNS
eukprot:GHVP01055564.1.p1 GENE.GHVP01055564.1~~GHVP01055564.1.p1  ORF type:complete len:242 (+),score=14.58 GHVP01055564.1:878-1603(+)